MKNSACTARTAQSQRCQCLLGWVEHGDRSVSLRRAQQGATLMPGAGGGVWCGGGSPRLCMMRSGVPWSRRAGGRRQRAARQSRERGSALRPGAPGTWPSRLQQLEPGAELDGAAQLRDRIRRARPSSIRAAQKKKKKRKKKSTNTAPGGKSDLSRTPGRLPWHRQSSRRVLQ